MKRLLLVVLATLSTAHAQLMNTPVSILRSEFFKTHQQTSPGTFQKGSSTLKLTSRAGVVLRADLTSNSTLESASQMIAYLTGEHREADLGKSVLGYLKEHQQDLCRRHLGAGPGEPVQHQRATKRL